MKVTIRDIAKAANVSPATVSNSFNGNNRVGKATRLRVLEIARQMGYQDPCQLPPNKRIQFVIFHKAGQSFMDPAYLSEMTSGVESACRKNQYEVKTTHIHAGDEAELNAVVNSARSPIILLATEMTLEDIRPFLQVKPPMLVLDSHFISISFSTFHLDNMKGGFLAGEHLIGRGHKTIGMVTAPFAINNISDRQRGLEMSLAQHGLRLEPHNLFPVEPTMEGAQRDIQAQLAARLSPMPTALFAYNDLVAMGTIRALQAHGLRVPEDVAVIGMDNIAEAAEFEPTLSSIHMPRYAMGYQAVEQLLLQIAHRSAPILKTAVDVSLVERTSTAALRT